MLSTSSPYSNTCPPSPAQKRAKKDVWFLWQDTARSPFLNMAIDEQCFHECSINSDPILRFYSWDRPSVSIGYFQHYDSLLAEDYTVIRRPTGGGIVFHEGNMTYSIIIPRCHWFYQVSRRENYRIISTIILDSLSLFNINGFLNREQEPTVSTEKNSQICFTNPAKFDVIVGDRKIAGAAQKRNRLGLLHQGCIAVDKFLKVTSDQLKKALIDNFERFFACKMILYIPHTKFFNAAGLLVKEKFNTSKWNKKR